MRFTAAPTPNVWVCANKKIKKKNQPPNQSNKTQTKNHTTNQKYFLKGMEKMHVKITASPETEIKDFSPCKALQTRTLTWTVNSSQAGGRFSPSQLAG